MKLALAIVMVLAAPALADKDAKSAAQTFLTAMVDGKGAAPSAAADKPIAFDVASPIKECDKRTGSITDAAGVTVLKKCLMGTLKKVGAKPTLALAETTPNIPEQKELKSRPKGTQIVEGEYTSGAKRMTVRLMVLPDLRVAAVSMSWHDDNAGD
jgi:hypothetical protein